jgi:hypothetical protein
MARTKYSVSEQQLRQLYEAQQQTIEQVAEVIGCHPSTVRPWLLKFGIQIRPKGRVPRDDSFEATRHRKYGRRYREKMTAEQKARRRERQRQRRGSVIRQPLPPDERERRRQKTHARYRDSHRGRLAANHRERRKRDDVKAAERAYRHANRERLSAINREWRKNNPEKVRARREARREEINTNHREYVARRMQEDVQFKLARQLRSRMNAAVRGGYRAGSAVDDLGMPIAEFRKHLESLWEPEMTWANYGKGPGKWCIDHIYPLARADLTKRLEFLAVANWRNQVPRWHVDNSAKLATITPDAQQLFDSLKEVFIGSCSTPENSTV